MAFHQSRINDERVATSTREFLTLAPAAVIANRRRRLGKKKKKRRPSSLNTDCPDSRALSVYPRTVSRTVELSLQSSFQLSLTVLVRYRSRWSYLALDGIHHPLRAALSSNPTLRSGSPVKRPRSLRAWHPLWVVAPFKGDLDRRTV